MFGSWGNYGLAPPEDLTSKERSPPPSPVRLDFPRSVPQPQTTPLTKSSLRNLRRILLNLKSHEDVKREHLEALNVKVTTDHSFEDLIPVSTQNLIPRNGEGPPSARPQLSNGMPCPGPEKYDIVERELRYSNDDAFRELVRLPPLPGKQRLRITQTRKFWAGLEKMSQYWDTSADQLYEGPVHPEDSVQNGNVADLEGPADAKRIKMDDNRTPSESDPMNIDQKSDELSNKESSQSPSQDQEIRLRYKGRRIGNGRTMPEELREETVRGFVEMIAWCFGCQVTMPSMPPRLSVGTLLFPVRHTFTVTRTPRDRMQARKGFLEGPIFVIQCKNEVSFRNEDDRVGDGHAEATDLFREVGAVLLLAQERARQNQVEILPGSGKWWTTKARWGGGPGGEMEVPPEGVTDEPPTSVTNPAATPPSSENKSKPPPLSPVTEKTSVADSIVAKAERRIARASGKSSSSSGSRRLSLAERWKILKPGSSLWDKKMQYLQIGKVKGDDFDDIYLLSSINTHISLLHVRIHPEYLNWLSINENDSSSHSQPITNSPNASILHIQRTKWYNLFDIDERIQAMNGIWALMAWMMRGGETGEVWPEGKRDPQTANDGKQKSSEEKHGSQQQRNTIPVMASVRTGTATETKS
ncbi:hypothetical protein UCRPC4_g06673 [Phaeomoniella chlamydospora]|uniref:Uncharacterized protein n=1 Tax=Phaeomoniella chlamydospora TaxID=158046 RepID=A0A0G2DVD1_PHACM|nr:hypothetical protein UCRPC4_g06673 [Phaeomoniella chlamydospora]